MKEMILIAGPCVVEDRDMCLRIAEHVKQLSERFGLRYVFKASYRKANRTSKDSFTGIGDEKALQIIKEVGHSFGIETITDVHESTEVEMAKAFVDHLQIPAFLCRQTSLLEAAGKSGCGVNIKKGQFLSPEAMQFPLEKVKTVGAPSVWLTERGTTFGYNDLVVDATSIARMKPLGAPVIMDCTHATQKPNRTEGTTGGDPDMIKTLALAAISTGADGLFIETHPEPKTAKSDSASMLQMSRLEDLLASVHRIWEATGNQHHIA